MTQRAALPFLVRSLRSRASTLVVGAALATLAPSLFASDASPQTPSASTVPTVPIPPTARGSAAPTPPTEPPRFVLTRLDVVHVGVVRDRGDVLSIELLDGGSVSVSKLDVQFIGGSRDDVFAFQKNRTRLEDVGETLRLADWANRRQLAPQAIALLETKLAEPLSDGERRAVVAKLEELRRIEKLRVSVAQTVAARQNASVGSTLPTAADAPASDDAATRPAPSASVASVAPVAPEVVEIERWAKEVPVSAFERFSRRAQPILQKRCATAGCHDGSNPNSAFRVRPKAVGPQARLALYFNLRETFDFIDFNDSARSPILNHPPVADAWGRRVYPFGEDRNSAKDCRAFVSWVESLDDGKLGRYVHRPSRVRAADAATLRPNAVSRYDRVAAPNAAAPNAAAPNAAAPNAANPFADLFDASTPPSAPTVSNPPTDAAPNAPAANAPDGFVFRSGTPREARRYFPNPADDPNSPENVLQRGGYAPKRQYRDEYDPAIFNAAAPDAPARY